MFKHHQRCIYRNNPLAEVICQLRFPEILSIEANAPVEFQEAIRDTFPIYKVAKEAVRKQPGAESVREETINNYHFISGDGIWKVNLTGKFISLSCSRYTRWEDFAKHLDQPLAAFIQIYRPAFFERIGLRYVNFFSRKGLSLEQEPFRNLFNSSYAGLLQEEELDEKTFTRCSVDAEFAIRGGCRAKIHAGPGIVTKNGQKDPELKFIFDQDLYMPGKTPVNLSAGAIQTLHSQADSIFYDAISETLHQAMDPEYI